MAHGFTPRLMQARDAAFYLGVSASKFHTLDLPRKVFGGNIVYDRADLDAFADRLAYDETAESDEARAVAACDALFGMGQ